MARQHHWHSWRDLLQGVRSFGVPALIALFFPVALLPFVGLSHVISLSVPALGAISLLSGLLILLRFAGQKRRALRLYSSGAFHRLDAIWAIEEAHRSFLLAHALIWAGGCWLMAAAILFGLGATSVSYVLAGGCLGVGGAHLFLGLFARRSIFRLLSCRQDALPLTGWSRVVRYGLVSGYRLDADRIADPDDLASLLAVIHEDDAQADGIALRIPRFGDWPGLKLVREAKLRLGASAILIGFGGLSGLSAAVILFGVIGLNYQPVVPYGGSHASGAPMATGGLAANPDSVHPGVGGNGASEGQFAPMSAPMSETGGVSRGDHVASNRDFPDANGNGPADGPKGDGAASQAEEQASAAGGADAQGSSEPAANASSESGVGSDLQDEKGQDAGGKPDSSSGSEGGDGGGVGVGQSAPQALSENGTDFPSASDGRAPLEIGMRLSGEGSDDGKGATDEDEEAFGQGEDQHSALQAAQSGETGSGDQGGSTDTGKGGASGSAPASGLKALEDVAIPDQSAVEDTATAERLDHVDRRRISAFADRGAKPVQVQTLHPRVGADDKNLPTQPHIPIQQLPQWMRILLESQSK
ncbi:hypothetical protein [uncultured Cohaesibacter sp.]|uniref:hypothetical protein n=1 Tax=uncultured Cohaesibacter sp. TaxID=1002546 RepID=UPI00292CEB4E|nr:hypothetical protein [uncultured Cohaesibacter sp.]